jgi:hypothetical protein
MLCFISSPRAIARFAANIAKLPDAVEPLIRVTPVNRATSFLLHNFWRLGPAHTDRAKRGPLAFSHLSPRGLFIYFIYTLRTGCGGSRQVQPVSAAQHH